MADDYAAAFAADREAYFAGLDRAEAVEEATKEFQAEIARLKARIIELEREIEGLYEDQAGEWV